MLFLFRKRLTSNHFRCFWSESQEWPRSLTPRLKNSCASWAMRPSSVVQTGVKSAGCENNTHHLKHKIIYIVMYAIIWYQNTSPIIWSFKNLFKKWQYNVLSCFCEKLLVRNAFVCESICLQFLISSLI